MWPAPSTVWDPFSSGLIICVRLFFSLYFSTSHLGPRGLFPRICICFITVSLASGASAPPAECTWNPLSVLCRRVWAEKRKRNKVSPLGVTPRYLPPDTTRRHSTKQIMTFMRRGAANLPLRRWGKHGAAKCSYTSLPGGKQVCFLLPPWLPPPPRSLRLNDALSALFCLFLWAALPESLSLQQLSSLIIAAGRVVVPGSPRWRAAVRPPRSEGRAAPEQTGGQRSSPPMGDGGRLKVRFSFRLWSLKPELDLCAILKVLVLFLHLFSQLFLISNGMFSAATGHWFHQRRLRCCFTRRFYSPVFRTVDITLHFCSLISFGAQTETEREPGGFWLAAWPVNDHMTLGFFLTESFYWKLPKTTANSLQSSFTDMPEQRHLLEVLYRFRISYF